MNGVEIVEAVSVLAEGPFDQPGFPYASIEAFFHKKATIYKLKMGDANKSDIERGNLQKINIHNSMGSRDDASKTLVAQPRSLTALWCYYSGQRR